MYSVASDVERMTDDVRTLMQWIGQPEIEPDRAALHADAANHFLKTHDLPSDNSPAIVLVRDGRDAVVSFAHFVLKTEQSIEHATTELFESTLKDIIRGDRFGGWSHNVKAWVDHAGTASVVRYEDLIVNPVEIATASVSRLGIQPKFKESHVPSFAELHASVPWFFRKGKQGGWREEMPPRLLELFLELHGETLVRLGYGGV